MKNEIVLFEAQDKSIVLPVQVDKETVWLNRNQMAELFGRDIKTIGKHIGNALKEELSDQVVVAKFATTTQHGAIANKTQTHMTEFYNLDVVISVGYRVKSQRGVEFRLWANSILKQYIMQGYATNQKRLDDLKKVVKLMQRTELSLDAHQVLTVVEKYSEALALLDSYDHQNMARPNGNWEQRFKEPEICMIEEPYFDDFLNAMFKHTKDYDNDLEEEMQRRFLNTIYNAKTRKKML